jgi:hypothetical protein
MMVQSSKLLKQKAINLRKLGKSYNEINRFLHIPKSTLSSWFKIESFSQELRNKLVKQARFKQAANLKRLAKINKEKWIKIHNIYRQMAVEEFTDLKDRKQFVAGLVAYWGEGDKKLQNSIVRISNSDPYLLKIFITFLFNYCSVDKLKIKAWILIYPDHKDTECLEYWSKILYIKKEQFLKTQIIIGKEKCRKSSYGICTVQVYSREIKEKIVKWIELFSQTVD